MYVCRSHPHLHLQLQLHRFLFPGALKSHPQQEAGWATEPASLQKKAGRQGNLAVDLSPNRESGTNSLASLLLLICCLPTSLPLDTNEQERSVGASLRSAVGIECDEMRWDKMGCNRDAQPRMNLALLSYLIRMMLCCFDVPIFFGVTVAIFFGAHIQPSPSERQGGSGSPPVHPLTR